MAFLPKKIIDQNPQVALRLIRFFVGLFLIFGLFIILASSSPPVGVTGDVLRHNLEADIDATPLFYSEVENIVEIDRKLQELRRERKHEIQKGSPGYVRRGVSVSPGEK